ncbi:YbaB/EbfC family nucleoid-associated protein [Nocardia sp. NPDC049149]|uniref:YbaB/EbfC family nucleoid-associated protein n=1 Tax=Nocardia sp. NPDC049149 TaxID=3364315 RepID=UPI00371E3D9C
MTNDRLRADAATMMDALHEHLTGLADIQQQRMALTASASACDKRIQVTVNASGVLIGTVFADDIGDLTYDEIAEAMTEAVQAAAADVERKGRALLQPLSERRSWLPKLSEMIEGAPNLDPEVPREPARAVPDLSDAAEHIWRKPRVSDQNW